MPWRNELRAEQERRRRQQLWRTRPSINSPQGTRIKRDDRHLVNFCSNDYLGLANSPELIAAMAGAAHTWGVGSGASHMVCGHMASHHALEEELAAFVGAERAILFSTGYMANLAIPAAFLDRNDLVLEDRLNHASMIDAGLLSRAKMIRYQHCDIAQLKNLLRENTARRKMVMTDAVFSMDGDQAPIELLRGATARHGALLVLDDAHGFGVLGANGAGSLASLDQHPGRNVLMVGTLGKAAGSFGAFVAGDDIYIETLLQHARPYIYTTALPPAVAETTRVALRIIAKDSWRRETLSSHIRHFRSGAASLGLTLPDSQTPIQPILLGDETSALEASRLLEEAGLMVTPIRPPTVPQGSSRLRITLSALHTVDDIDRLLESLGSSAFRRVSRAAKQ
jgi:8-amino-7-oxononanoate synthase